MNPADATASGATAVITHRVRDGNETDYDRWLNEIMPLCKASPGHLDLQIVRPIAGLTTTYTVVIRFDTCDHLRQWLVSPDRRRLIERAKPLLAADEDYTIRSGLDFWFTPPGTTKVPVRWKQFLLTWSAIYPLVLGVPLVVVPLLHQFGAPDNRFLTTLLVTATVVLLMVYVVVVEWFPEPAGLRVVNQPEVAGVIRNDSNNMDVTQTFTVTSSGLLSAVGFALGFPAGTPSITTSLYRVSDGVVQPVPFATSFLPREYFENIGPQTVPVWAYAEFSSAAEVTAGEQVAFRLHSPFAQLWGPRSDVLPGGELQEIPGTDLAFRAYVVPEPEAGVLCLSALCLLLGTRGLTRRGSALASVSSAVLQTTATFPRTGTSSATEASR